MRDLRWIGLATGVCAALGCSPDVAPLDAGASDAGGDSARAVEDASVDGGEGAADARVDGAREDASTRDASVRDASVRDATHDASDGGTDDGGAATLDTLAWLPLDWAPEGCEAALASDPERLAPLRWEPCPGSEAGCEVLREPRTSGCGSPDGCVVRSIDDASGYRYTVHYGQDDLATRAVRATCFIRDYAESCTSLERVEDGDATYVIACGEDWTAPDFTLTDDTRAPASFAHSDALQALLVFGMNRLIVTDLRVAPAVTHPIGGLFESVLLQGDTLLAIYRPGGNEPRVLQRWEGGDSMATLRDVSPNGISTAETDAGRLVWLEVPPNTGMLREGSLWTAPWPALGQPLQPQQVIGAVPQLGQQMFGHLSGDYFMHAAPLGMRLHRISDGASWFVAVPEGFYGSSISASYGSLNARWLSFRVNDEVTTDPVTVRFTLGAVTGE